MSELSPEARAILDAAGPGPSPTDTAVDHMRRGLSSRLGIAMPPPVPPAAAPWWLGTPAKMLVVAVLGAAAGVGVGYSAGRRAERSPARRAEHVLVDSTITPSPSVAARATAPLVADIDGERPSHEAPSPERVTVPSTRQATPRMASRIGRVTAPLGTPDAGSAPRVTGASETALEFDMLQSAHAALEAGRARDALAVLDRLASMFPRSALDLERRSIRAMALCAAGNHDEGRGQAASLLRDAPRSPYARSLRVACGVD